MEIPEGYVHKATSESFNGGEKVTILYNRVDDDYLLIIDKDEWLVTKWTVTKTQLELIVHAGADVLHDAKV